jgi:hypothetical protein
VGIKSKGITTLGRKELLESMANDFRTSMAKARQAFKKGDDTGTVSWLGRAASAVPEANASDEGYEKVYARLSDIVAGSGR